MPSAMGTFYLFRCNKCHYSIQSSGKLDFGVVAVTQTLVCNACRQVVDVLVGLRGETFSKEEIGVRKEADDAMSDFNFYSCPECGSEDLSEWDTKRRPCPKCDGKMKKEEIHDMIMWD